MTDFASCNHADSWLSLAVDGELSREELNRLQRHLRQCPPCNQRHEQLVVTDQRLSEEIQRDLDAMEALLEGRITARHIPRRRLALRGVGLPLAVAASVGFVALGFSISGRWERTPSGPVATSIDSSTVASSVEVAQAAVPVPLGTLVWDANAPGLRVVLEDGRVVSVSSPAGSATLLATAVDDSSLLLEVGGGDTVEVPPGAAFAVPAGDTEVQLELVGGGRILVRPGSEFRLSGLYDERRFRLEAGEIACRGQENAPPIRVQTEFAAIEPSADASGAWFSVQHGGFDRTGGFMTRVVASRGAVLLTRVGSGTPIRIQSRDDGSEQDAVVTATRLTVDPALALSAVRRAREAEERRRGVAAPVPAVQRPRTSLDLPEGPVKPNQD